MKKYVGLFSFILLLSFIYRPAQAKDLVNDVIITEEDTIYEYDVGIENFDLPDTVNPGESIPVQFTLVNYGTRIAIFDFVFEIHYPDSFYWTETIFGITLYPRQRADGDCGT